MSDYGLLLYNLQAPWPSVFYPYFQRIIAVTYLQQTEVEEIPMDLNLNYALLKFLISFKKIYCFGRSLCIEIINMEVANVVVTNRHVQKPSILKM